MPRMHRTRSAVPVRIGYYLFVAVVVFAILFSFYQLAGALIASLLLSFLLAPIVNFAENRGIHRVVVVLAIYLIVAGALLLAIIFVGPLLSDEIMRLTGQLPEYEKQLEEMLTRLQASITERFPALKLPELYPFITSQLTAAGKLDIGSLLSRMSELFSLVMVLVIIPVVTFFFIVDGHLFQKAVLRLVPNRYFEMCVLLLNRTGAALQNFIRGQLIDAFYVGVMTTIGMAIIGLPYFLAIGIFAGLGNLIPYLGPIIGFIPAFFVALLTPGWFTFGNIALIAVIFVVVQVSESTFVYPVVVGKSANLHPLIVILGIMIGGRFGGIFGMLIAIPLISIVKVVLEVVSAYLKSYRII